ncbi:MAG: hypothetical protein ACRCWI_04105 [Brevinema sp.]
MKKEQWLKNNKSFDRDRWIGKEKKPYGWVDGLFDVLELPVNITASIFDVLHDEKMDRPFLDNTFSAMLADSKKGEEMNFGDHALGFTLDVLLDPTTYLGIGAFSKVDKISDALQIVKGVGKIDDLSKLNRYSASPPLY